MPTTKYKHDGKRVPSVTTVIREDVGGLIYWAEKGAANCTEEVGGSAAAGLGEWRARKADNMDAGSYCHFLIEQYFGADTEPPSVSLGAEERGIVAYRHFERWHADADICRVVALEEHYVSGQLLTGGTPDLVYEDGDGRLVVADWKTSEKPKLRPEHVMQLAAYAMLVGENLDRAVSYLRLIGFPTVEDAEVLDVLLPTSAAIVAQGGAAFLAKRAAYDTGSKLRKLVDELAAKN